METIRYPGIDVLRSFVRSELSTSHGGHCIISSGESFAWGVNLRIRPMSLGRETGRPCWKLVPLAYLMWPSYLVSIAFLMYFVLIHGACNLSLTRGQNKGSTGGARNSTGDRTPWRRPIPTPSIRSTSVSSILSFLRLLKKLLSQIRKKTVTKEVLRAKWDEGETTIESDVMHQEFRTSIGPLCIQNGEGHK